MLPVVGEPGLNRQCLSREPHDSGPADLHGTLRAEFLTAETVDADTPVDLRLFIFHRDGFSRAGSHTGTAADAEVRHELRKRRQDPPGDTVRDLSRQPLTRHVEEDAALRRDGPKVRDGKTLRISIHGE